jgi:hypothetical protein
MAPPNDGVGVLTDGAHTIHVHGVPTNGVGAPTDGARTIQVHGVPTNGVLADGGHCPNDGSATRIPCVCVRWEFQAHACSCERIQTKALIAAPMSLYGRMIDQTFRSSGRPCDFEVARNRFGQ